MHKNTFTTTIPAATLMALVFTFTAQAQNSRSFVATNGNDTNNCSASAYCRTFAKALAVTNSGGEVVVVNSGGYGPFTISQPVTISAVGIDASITATSGDAIYIDTTGDVTITGLHVMGSGGPVAGIYAHQVGVLRLYNIQIQGFIDFGIAATNGDEVAVYDSRINDNGEGIEADGVQTQVYVHNTGFDHNMIGVLSVLGANVTVVDSSAEYNGQYGFRASGGTLALYNDRVNFNGVGIQVDGSAGIDGAGKVYFANCLLTGNTTHSWEVDAGGNLSSSSPATNLITPGQSTSGTLSTAMVIQ
jgi:hypothetical protein